MTLVYPNCISFLLGCDCAAQMNPCLILGCEYVRSVLHPEDAHMHTLRGLSRFCTDTRFYYCSAWDLICCPDPGHGLLCGRPEGPEPSHRGCLLQCLLLEGTGAQ